MPDWKRWASSVELGLPFAGAVVGERRPYGRTRHATKSPGSRAGAFGETRVDADSGGDELDAGDLDAFARSAAFRAAGGHDGDGFEHVVTLHQLAEGGVLAI